MVIFVPCFYFSRCCQYSSGFLGLYIYLPKLCIQHCNEFRTWPKLVQFDTFLSWPASKLRVAKNLCLVFSCNDANNGGIFWEIKFSNIFVFLVVLRQSESNFCHTNRKPFSASKTTKLRFTNASISLAGFTPRFKLLRTAISSTHNYTLKLNVEDT